MVDEHNFLVLLCPGSFLDEHLVAHEATLDSQLLAYAVLLRCRNATSPVKETQTVSTNAPTLPAGRAHTLTTFASGDIGKWGTTRPTVCGA